MKITVMTLFPEFFDSFVTTSIIKRAIERELVTFETIDFRAYTKDKHNHVAVSYTHLDVYKRQGSECIVIHCRLT